MSGDTQFEEIININISKAKDNHITPSKVAKADVVKDFGGVVASNVINRTVMTLFEPKN